MAKLLYSIPAVDILIDSQDNTASLVRIIEQVSSPSLPISMGMIKVMTLWVRESASDRKFRVRATPHSPNGTPQPDASRVATLEGENQNHRWMINFPAWTVDMAGLWKVKLEIEAKGKWTPAGEFQIPIKVLPPSNAK